MNPYSFFLFTILIGAWLGRTLIEYLNISYLKTEVPEEFQNLYDEKKYETSQKYLKENTVFGVIKSTFSLALTLFFILAGGFQIFDVWARHWGLGPIMTGLVFVGSLSVLSAVVSLPFSLYKIFVIEEKYGFNKMTLKTFCLDLVKGAILGSVLGGVLVSLVLWFFETTGAQAWLWAWCAVTVFELVVAFVAPVVIMPLFNKFSPLAEGELKTAVETYAQSQNFKMQGLFTMDGSRRSSKANAFFTGFGRFRRIVLFDTLIAQHTVDELTAVLAHEIGHYKRHHILKQLALSIVTTGLTFYLLSLFLNNLQIFAAFHVEQTSVYASLVFFLVLYSPFARVLSLGGLYLSRKYEFEADAFAAETYKKPESLALALKKLSVETLSNLNPHPVKVFVDYTHPPVLERVRALRY